MMRAARRGRWTQVLVAMGMALVATPASAHLLPRNPDLDRWLTSGPVLVLAEARSTPKPCGTAAWPAVQPVTVTEVVGGTLEAKELEVLIVDDHTAVAEAGTAGLLVLRPAAAHEASGCASAPGQVVAGPFERPVIPADDLELWRRYAGGLASLPKEASPTDPGRLALWTMALSAETPILARHAVTRLEAYPGHFPDEILEAIRHLAEDETAHAETRARAVQVAGDVFDPILLGNLATDESLIVGEAAVAKILAGDPRRLRYAGAPIHTRLGELRAENGERPVDEIRITALAACLASLGDPQGRDLLVEGLDNRLYKVRAYAIRGLLALAAQGDKMADAWLDAAASREPDGRLRDLLGPRAATAPPEVSTAAAERAERTGLRMTLVLVGLLVLIGLVLLPVVVPRGTQN